MTRKTIFGLPKPVRNILWEMTLTPRVLSLQYRRVFHAECDDIQCCTLSIRPSPQTDDTCSFMYISCNNISSIPCLSICREARSYALSRGYRAWRLQDTLGRTRNVMWNPDLDTVFFDGLTQNLGRDFFYNDIIARQFPDEMMEVQFLALLSSHWPSEVPRISPVQFRERHLLPEPMLQFKALSELCVVLDGPYEFGYAQVIKSSQNRPVNAQQPSTSWTVPDDIEEVFRIEKTKAPESNSNVPKVRFVKSQHKIINGSGESMILRCYPCPDLFRLMELWRK